MEARRESRVCSRVLPVVYTYAKEVYILLCGNYGAATE